MKLSEVPKNQEARILGFEPNWSEKFQNRLSELGFGKGHIVTCVRKTPLEGPQVFRSADTLYSLGSDVTDYIFVELVKSL